MRSDQQSQSIADFDFAGLVRVRLVGALPGVRRQVEQELGLRPVETLAAPHVIMRRGEEGVVGPCTYVGDHAVDGQGRFIDGASGPAWAAIPLCDVGGPCQIDLGPAVDRVRLLPEIIKLTALAQGGLPLHAAAFRLRECGVVAAGWAHGGKTGLLLAALRQGADWVADDCAVFLPSSDAVVGAAGRMAIKAAYLDQIPSLRRRLPAGLLFRIACKRRLKQWGRGLADFPLGKLLPARVRRRLSKLNPQETALEGDARSLFASRIIASNSVNVVVLTAVGTDQEASLAPVDVDRAADQIALLLVHERAPLVEAYRSMQYAAPGLHNPLLERAATIEAERIRELLRGRMIVQLRRPNPASIADLEQALLSLVSEEFMRRDDGEKCGANEITCRDLKDAVSPSAR